ncbi:WD40-repeat-containing domain protein [Lanmaoa asiatica]|nr:WD40-repeat-containing domain protein [Lanmaoa asiatica]
MTQLMDIKTIVPSDYAATPLAWSNNGQQIFAVSNNKKIKSFDVSTGSQCAESQIFDGGGVYRIVLAANGKFIATYYADCSISFLDPSTLVPIGPAIEDSATIKSIAISPDDSYLAIGRGDGKITMHDLGGILPEVYGPFHVSIFPFMHQ